MEPLFQVEFYSSHKMIREFYRKCGFGPRPATLIVFWSAFVLLALYCWANGIPLTQNLQIMVLVLALAAMSFFPEFMAWAGTRSTKKQNDGVLPKTILAFSDTIQMEEGMVHLTIEYRKIVKVIHLKHSYVLMIGKQNGVILDPNGFTKGTFEEFKQFLREKRPDLTIPE